MVARREKPRTVTNAWSSGTRPVPQHECDGRRGAKPGDRREQVDGQRETGQRGSRGVTAKRESQDCEGREHGGRPRPGGPEQQHRERDSQERQPGESRQPVGGRRPTRTAIRDLDREPRGLARQADGECKDPQASHTSCVAPATTSRPRQLPRPRAASGPRRHGWPTTRPPAATRRTTGSVGRPRRHPRPRTGPSRGPRGRPR